MISDAELIALWHTKESRTTIAARLQIPGAILQQECSSMAVCADACAVAFDPLLLKRSRRGVPLVLGAYVVGNTIASNCRFV